MLKSYRIAWLAAKFALGEIVASFKFTSTKCVPSVLLASGN